MCVCPVHYVLSAVSVIGIHSKKNILNQSVSHWTAAVTVVHTVCLFLAASSSEVSSLVDW